MIITTYHHAYLDITELRKIDKRVFWAYVYSSDEPMQERIDEEGCGAVYAAAKFPQPSTTTNHPDAMKGR